MLEEILRACNNWFLVSDGIHTGTFSIEGGSVALPFLADGQYFRIVGSVFNDGVYQYPPSVAELVDETFDGAVWALAIPKSVVDLAERVQEWNEKYQATAAGPYQSESFGGLLQSNRPRDRRRCDLENCVCWRAFPVAKNREPGKDRAQAERHMVPQTVLSGLPVEVME